ncbi:MAG TPA: hypothetical protein VMY37_37750 [Thermoguttaceae bacterium]|nr:hypothetical protein [Thermoguttaceae bacterium]
MEVLNAGAATERPDVASERIVAEIRRRLHSTGFHALRSVECEYRDGTVVLRGRVATYYHKQLAQAVLLIDPLVETLVNLIDVSDNGGRAFAKLPS